MGMTAGMPVLLVLSSCSLNVKVRENWRDSHRAPIPMGEVSKTWAEIRSGSRPDEESLRSYNAAVEGSVVQIAKNWTSRKDNLSLISTTYGDLNFKVDMADVTDLHLIDEMVPADFVKVKQGFKSESRVDGIGTSILVKQRWSEADPMIPSSGLWYPVTAILNLDRPESPVIELIDPTKQPDLSVGGLTLPLSANYTAALGRDFQDRQHQFAELPALLKFEKFADRTGLYRVSAFDPGKRVCIFVHGIYSSPSTFDETINRLFDVPEIRERYEIWTFGYPTGAPIPYMASELREAIYEMLEFRRRRGASEQNMTIVGHSMGGLLAKTLTMSSGDENWNKLFRVPIEELEVSESEREVLRRMIYFEPVPHVDKVIFCATPHYGAKIAENPGAKLIGDLIEGPAQLVKLSTNIISNSAYALTPLGFEFAKERMTSVDQLGSKARTTAEFLHQPLNLAVDYYSIIGNRKGPDTPREKMTDGVVPYMSAHILGVESEIVINKSPHGVHRTEGGIQEIIRILKLP